MEEKQEIRKEISKTELVVTKISKSIHQKKNTLSAELRQTVITKSYYPKQSIKDSLIGNIFKTEEFGFEEEVFESKENRIAWINVPENSTIESVTERLKEYPDACLYRILSNHPILSDTQVYAINSELLNVTKDTFADKQVVRYSENSEKSLQLILDKNGKPQYRRILFSEKKQEDIELRNSEPTDYYTSPKIKEEMENRPFIFKGQDVLKE